jgi:hypothetical protein
MKKRADPFPQPSNVLPDASAGRVLFIKSANAFVVAADGRVNDGNMAVCRKNSLAGELFPCPKPSQPGQTDVFKMF